MRIIVALVILLISLTVNAQSIGGNSFNKPIIAVSAQGKAEISEKVTYQVLIYADSYSIDESGAKMEAEKIKKSILAYVKTTGGKDTDVIISFYNILKPNENDKFFRVQQDIAINISNQKESDIRDGLNNITGVQIASVIPVFDDISQFNNEIISARNDAVKNAKFEANGIAASMKVKLGDPVFISEVIYPPNANTPKKEVIVQIMIYYEFSK